MEGREPKKMKVPQDNKKKNLNTTEKIILGVLVVVALGIVMTYIPWGKKEAEPTFVAESSMTTEEKDRIGETYEEGLEIKLETILGDLDGAGQTKVMVTTSTTDERVLAEEVVECIQDTDETDKSGRTKSNSKQDTTRKVVMQKGDTPFIIKENRPQIEGVLVLAEGADDSNVKNAIIQAVASVLDVPVHKIAVFKMATN